MTLDSCTSCLGPKAVPAFERRTWAPERKGLCVVRVKASINPSQTNLTVLLFRADPVKFLFLNIKLT